MAKAKGGKKASKGGKKAGKKKMSMAMKSKTGCRDGGAQKAF